MGTEPQSPSHRPTLEDLLRYKRAERPAPEFWAEFDRGLRQKQLAALMKRPKGWARIRPVLGRSLRWAVPATAAAAVALVVVQIPLVTTARKTPVEIVSQPVRTEAVASSVAPDAQALLAAVSAAHMRTIQAAASERPVDVQTDPAPAVELASASAPVSPSVPAERVLSWGDAVLPENANRSFRSPDAFSTRSEPVAARHARSSWTSRFNQMVQEITAEQATDRMLQLASFKMPVTSEPAAAFSPVSSTGGTYAAATPKAREPRDRDFRDLDSRFGVTGSSLSIKF